MPSSAPAFEPASFSTADAEVQAAHSLPEEAAELGLNLGLVSQGPVGAHGGRIQAATARCACFKGAKRWLAATRDSLCWPYALAIAGDTAVVMDSGNNRVLWWDVVR